MEKRIISVAIVICVLMTCLFVGCKKTEDLSEVSSQSETKTEATTPTTEEPTTLDLSDPEAIKAAAGDYFKDVAFIGDSISVGLSIRAPYLNRLAGATYLVRGSYGSRHAVDGSMLLTYKGSQMSPEDAVKACGCKKLFIMLGMNDLNMYSKLDGTVNNLRTMITNIQKKNPNVKIFIQSMTPIVIGSEKKPFLNNTSIDEYNELLKKLAAELGCVYINVATPLKNSSNGLDPKYSSDQYVHLNPQGLDIWISALELFAATQDTNPKPIIAKPSESTTVSEGTTAKSEETTKPAATTTTKPASTTKPVSTTIPTTAPTTQPTTAPTTQPTTEPTTQPTTAPTTAPQPVVPPSPPQPVVPPAEA